MAILTVFRKNIGAKAVIVTLVADPTAGARIGTAGRTKSDHPAGAGITTEARGATPTAAPLTPAHKPTRHRPSRRRMLPDVRIHVSDEPDLH
jgi:hypothetical protein